MLVLLAITVVVLVAAAVTYDLIARWRGAYRPTSEWLAVSRRRKTHFRRTRNARGTYDRDRR
jgi:hypothetical protein